MADMATRRRPAYCKACGGYLNGGTLDRSAKNFRLCVECEEPDEVPECECNVCFGTSLEDPTLAQSLGRVCPYCCAGVVQRVEP